MSVPMFPVSAGPGTTVNTLGNSTWSSANPGGTMGTNPYGSGFGSSPDTSTTNSAEIAWKNALAEEQRRQYDQTFNQNKTTLDRNYQLQLAQVKSQDEKNKLDAQYQQATLQLTQARLAQEQQQFGMTQAQQESQFARTFGLNQSQLAEQKRQFDATGALNTAQLAENKRQFDVSQGNEMAKFGITSGMTQQQIDAQIQQFGVTSGMTQQQIDAQKAQFGVTSGETAREFNANNSLAQANVGLGLVNAAATAAQNPADYWAEAERERGYASMPETATFLTNLRNNTKMPGFSAYAGTPQAGSLDTLLQRFPGGAGGQTAAPGASPDGGGMAEQQQVYAGGSPGYSESGGYYPSTGTPGVAGAPSGRGTDTMGAAGAPTSYAEGGGAQPMYGEYGSGGTQRAAVMPSGYTDPTAARDANNLNAIRGIYTRGAQKLGAGSLESLDPTEFALFKSGIGAAGGDSAGFLQRYRNSRIGNTANARAA